MKTILGKFSPEHEKLVIVGGGFSGLILAYRLRHLYKEVHVLEKSDRLGGLIQTIHTEHGLIESGPHSMRVTPVVRSLFQELGVPLVTLKEKARFMVRGGKLKKIPLSLSEILVTAKLFFRAGRVLKDEAAWKSFQTLEEVSLALLGKPFTEHVLSAGTLGIFGASPSELSARLADPLAARFTQKTTKAKSLMAAPRDGMESVVDKLVEKLRESPHVKLTTRAAVSSLERLQADHGRTATTIAITTDAPTAALLTGNRTLAQIKYVGLASLTLVLKKSSFKKVPKGVGFLSPPNEQDHALGILFPSSSFWGRVKSNQHITLTVLFGGTVRPDLVRASELELTDLALQTLHKYFGLKDRGTESVVESKLFSWPSAIPLYAPGFDETLKKANEELGQKPGLLVFGNYTGQVSLRGLIETLEPLKHLRQTDELADFTG